MATISVENRQVNINVGGRSEEIVAPADKKGALAAHTEGNLGTSSVGAGTSIDADFQADFAKFEGDGEDLFTSIELPTSAVSLLWYVVTDSVESENAVAETPLLGVSLDTPST